MDSNHSRSFWNRGAKRPRSTPPIRDLHFPKSFLTVKYIFSKSIPPIIIFEGQQRALGISVELFRTNYTNIVYTISMALVGTEVITNPVEFLDKVNEKPDLFSSIAPTEIFHSIEFFYSFAKKKNWSVI